GILSDLTVSPPLNRYYRLLASQMPGASNHKELMQGVDLAPGGVARRRSTPLAVIEPEKVKAIRASRNLLGLAETPAGPLGDPNRLLAQIGPMMRDLPDGQGAAAASALANQYVRLGRWSLAREIFLMMADRYPAHPLSADAYRWLIRHNSS